MGDQCLPNINTGDGHNNVDTRNNSDHSDSTWSDSPDNIIVDDIITFNKNHFIVQDLGMGEMFAEGKSKVHIHLNTKSEFKQLLQRLNVKVGENKGWDVLFSKISLVEIPKIDHLLQKTVVLCTLKLHLKTLVMMQVNVSTSQWVVMLNLKVILYSSRM